MDRIKSKDYEADAIIGRGCWRIGIDLLHDLIQTPDNNQNAPANSATRADSSPKCRRAKKIHPHRNQQRNRTKHQLHTAHIPDRLASDPPDQTLRESDALFIPGASALAFFDLPSIDLRSNTYTPGYIQNAQGEQRIFKSGDQLPLNAAAKKITGTVSHKYCRPSPVKHQLR